MSMPSSEMPEGTLAAVHVLPPFVVRRIVDFHPTAHPRSVSQNCTLVRFLRTPGSYWFQAPVAARARRNEPSPTATAAVAEKATAFGFRLSSAYSSFHVAPASVVCRMKPFQSAEPSAWPDA